MKTNVDKYLKESVNVEEFAKEIARHLYNDKNFMYFEKDYLKIKNWLNEQVQPTLTEDERIILKNIQNKQKVIFNDGFNLWTRDVELEDNFFGQFNHLFQFIKERRRILY